MHLTDRCNLNCRHCLRDPELAPNDLSLSLVERVLDQLGPYGETEVALTGGEPLLHPQILAIVDAVVSRGLRWRAVTNGARLDTLSALLASSSRRRAASRIVVSLDGALPATHDQIRGDGSYDDVLRAVAMLVALDVPFTLQCVVNRLNEAELETYGLLAAQLGAAAVSFACLTPTGTHHDSQLALPRAAWNTLQARVDRLAGILRIPVLKPEGHPRTNAFHVCAPWRGDALHVDVHGKMSLCCQLSGTPSGELSDELADLATESLLEGHLKGVKLIHELQRRRLEAIAAGTLGPWDELPCNWCQKQFGKPHWTDTGVGGAAADRARWRGAWANGATGRVRLPIVT